MSGAPVFAAATQGMPLNHLTLEVGSWCACLGLLERTPKRQVSASCPHQGTAQTGDCSTPPGFLWKTPTCLSWSFRLRCHFQVWHTSEGLRGDAQGTEARGDVITTLPQHSSSVVSQKGAYKLTRSPNFCDCHPGDTSRSSGGHLGLHLQPTVCMCFKSCSP